MTASISRPAPLVSAAAAAARPRCLASRTAAVAAVPRPVLGPAGLRGSSLCGTVLAARPAAVAAPAGRRQVAVAASWNRNSSPDVPDRVVAALPYLIPLLVRRGGTVDKQVLLC